MSSSVLTVPVDFPLDLVYPVYPLLWHQNLVGRAPTTTTKNGLTKHYSEQLWLIPNLTDIFSRTIFGIYTYRSETLSVRLLSKHHRLSITPGGKRRGIELRYPNSEFFIPEGWLFNLTIRVDEGFPIFHAQSVASKMFGHGYRLTSMSRTL